VHRSLSKIFSLSGVAVTDGVPTDGGGTLRLAVCDLGPQNKSSALARFRRILPDMDRIDHRILATVLLIQENDPAPAILVDVRDAERIGSGTVADDFDQAFRAAAMLAREPLRSILSQSVREMELGSTRREAFDGLTGRCPVRELSSLLNSLLEAEKRGHSLSSSLAVFSHEIRLRRRDQVREAGAKAPLKMLVPLIFLILPASVLLTVGPTFLVTLQRVF